MIGMFDFTSIDEISRKAQQVEQELCQQTSQRFGSQSGEYFYTKGTHSNFDQNSLQGSQPPLGQPHNHIQREQQAPPQGQQNPTKELRWQANQNNANRCCRTDQQDIVCHSCKQHGHYTNECPHKNLHCEGEPNDDE